MLSMARIDTRSQNRWDVRAGMKNVHRDMRGNVIGGITAEGKGLGTKAGKKRGLSGRGLSTSTPGLDRQNKNGLAGGSPAGPVAAPAASRHWSQMTGGALPQKSGGLGKSGGGSAGGGGGTPEKVGGLGSSGGGSAAPAAPVDNAAKQAFAGKLRDAKSSGRWDRGALRSEAASLGISNEAASKYWGSLPGANKGVARAKARVAEMNSGAGKPAVPSIKGSGGNETVTRGDFDEYSQKHGSEAALAQMGKRLDGYAADRSSREAEMSSRLMGQSLKDGAASVKAEGAKDRGGKLSKAKPAAPAGVGGRPSWASGSGGSKPVGGVKPVGVLNTVGSENFGGFTPTLKEVRSGPAGRRQLDALGAMEREKRGEEVSSFAKDGQGWREQRKLGAEVKKRDYPRKEPAWVVAARKKKGLKKGILLADQ